MEATHETVHEANFSLGDQSDVAALVKYAAHLEAENEKLRGALECADYYIGRMERAQRRLVVRDMTEAMEGYKHAKASLASTVETTPAHR